MVDFSVRGECLSINFNFQIFSYLDNVISYFLNWFAQILQLNEKRARTSVFLFMNGFGLV
jgi:hypothetical protein